MPGGALVILLALLASIWETGRHERECCWWPFSRVSFVRGAPAAVLVLFTHTPLQIAGSHESANQQAAVALAGAQTIVAIDRVRWLGQHGALAVPAVVTSMPSLRSDRHLLLDGYFRDPRPALLRCKGV